VTHAISDRTGRISRVPLTVWVITFFWGSMLLGASLLWPMTTGLDEGAHVDLAYQYSAHPFTFYGPGNLQYSKGVIGAMRLVPNIPQGAKLATAPIPGRSNRPTLDQLGGHQVITGGPPDQMVQHPPLYYWADAIVLRLPGVSGLAWDEQLWLMRLMSVVFMLPIPILCWATAKRLMASSIGGLPAAMASRYAVVAALLPLTVPNLIRDGASVENDTLLILATSVVIYGLARVVTGDLGRKTAALIATATAVALWTKGFALALPLIVAIGYGWGAVRTVHDRATAMRTLIQPVAILVAGFLIGSIWWIRNLVDYHALQPNGWGAYYSVIRGTPDHHGTLIRFLPPFMDQFSMRIWGEVGIPDIPSPGPLIIWGWLAVAVIGCIGALLVKGRTGSRRSLALLGLVPAAFFAIEISGSYSTFQKWSTNGPIAVQGRYIYGGIVAAAALIAVGWHKLIRPRLYPRLALITCVGAAATNFTVWLLILRSWYAPSGDHGLISASRAGFHSLLRWSPVPDAVTILLVAIGPAVTGVMAVAVLAAGHRPEGKATGLTAPEIPGAVRPAGRH
jgi:small subunit ribosomal protein S36